MFRGYLPALTLIVFGIGMGIGLSWSQGLIPLTITPANSGSLSVEVAQRELLPPPNDATDRRNDSTNDQANFEPQSEPEIVTSTGSATEKNRSRTTRSARDEEFANRSTTTISSERNSINRGARDSQFLTETDDAGQANSPDDQASSAPPIRTRNRSAVQIDSEAGIEEAPPASRGRSVVAARHQDPIESANDSRPSTRDVKETSLSPREQLAAAEEKLASGETLAAHRDLSKLYWNHKELRPLMQDTIDSTAKAIFFQPKPHYIDPYVVQEGDQLKTIAKKYQLSWEYLSKLNQTEPRRIQIGQKMKVVKGPFSAVVDLQEFALTIHLQGYYVKRYNVGIGQDGSSPIGKFPVLNKVENPQYTAPDGKVIDPDDPSNPLGERWLDLGGSYGIHGTIDPNSIGKAKSRGCIRLRDEDIIEVYNFLVKGSEVVIRK